MNIPEELKYTKGHEWISLHGDVALVGITDYAQHRLGPLGLVEIQNENLHLKSGDVLGTIETNKTVSDIFIPVDGQIIERNQQLDKAPEYVNYHPYDKGWLIKISVLNRDQMQELLNACDYRALIST